MYFGFTPVAEASVVTLMKSINKVVINPIIFFLFALAMVYFLYGVAQYLLSPDNEEIHKKSKSQMLYGVIGLFVMVAVFGIMNLILNTVGEKKIKIQNTGDYEIVNTGNSDNTFDSYKENPNLNYGGGDFISGQDVDLRDDKIVDLTNVPTIRPDNFSQSPFRTQYANSPFCWRGEIYAYASTEYQSLQNLKTLAHNAYVANNGLAVVDRNMPLSFGVLTAYDADNKRYHSWMDARAPIKGGSNNDCVLAVTGQTELPLESYVINNPFSTPVTNNTATMSTVDIFTTVYESDALFHRVRGIGISPLLELARNIAIKEAFAALNIEIEVNQFTIVYPTARILEEKYIFNETSRNFEYWVAIESSR